MKRLVAKSKYDGSVFFELVWNNSKTEVVYAIDTLKNRINETVENGLHEWIEIPGELYEHESRSTQSSEPEFLQRYADYLKRQTVTFLFELTETQ